jgi:hypothetical protein
MSTEPSGACPAPLDVDFRIIEEFEQYVVVTKRHVVWRIHSHDDKTGKPFGPVFFSTQQNSRWDFEADPSIPNSHGVMCVGQTFQAALIETFSKKWPSMLVPVRPGMPAYSTARVLTPDDVNLKYASRLSIPADLKLFDLTHPGALSSVGLDAWVTSTKEYTFTRTWAQWFFKCPEIDGLIYSSRPGGARMTNYVLFNRVGLRAKLESGAKKARKLADWRFQLAQASRVLNFMVLSPLPRRRFTP